MVPEVDMFKALAESSPDCIKLFNLDNKIEYMNKGGLEEHNFKSADEAVGFDWTETVVPEQRDEVLRKIRESVDGKKTVYIDVHHLPEFSNRTWCSLSISPVFNGNGDVMYFVGISRDISERKRGEQELIIEMGTEREQLRNILAGRELMMSELKRENEDLKEESVHTAEK